MEKGKRNKIIGIIVLAWVGLLLISASGWTTRQEASGWFVLSPSGYIEFDCKLTDCKLTDFWANIHITGGYSSNGITCYLFNTECVILGTCANWARGFQNYTYSAIAPHSEGSATFPLEWVLFDYDDIRYATLNFLHVVIVPAVNHVFNTKNLTISIEVYNYALDPVVISYSLCFAIPAILLAIAAIVSSRVPVIRPPPAKASASVSQTPSAPQPAPPTGKRYCPTCGAEINAVQKFCDKCGAGQ